MPARPLARLARYGGLALLLFGLLYFNTRTRAHTFDAVSYMWNIEAKPYGELFHPHHLLYAPLGQAAFHFAAARGYTGHSDTPIQAVNAVAGALGLVCLWRFAVRRTGRPWLALGVAALVGAAYAYWLYAAEVEVYTLSTAFLCLALWILAVLDEQPRVLLAAALGVAHGAAIMFHQTNLLFAAPVGLFLLLRPNLRRLPILFAYGLALGLTVLISYGVVILHSGFRDWSAVYDWLTAYAQTGRWGGNLGLQHLPALWSGLSNAVSPTSALAVLFYLLVALGLGFSVYAARRDSTQRAWLAFGLTWLALYGGFFWWWEPWNIEFWIATLPLMAFWMLGLAGEASSRAAPSTRDDARGLAGPVTPPLAGEASPGVSRSRWMGLLPLVLAGPLLWQNLAPVRAAGDPQNDYYFRMTEALQTILQPSDLVITRGNILDVYLPFYADHGVFLSTRDLDYRFNGDRAALMVELQAQLDWGHRTGQALVFDQLVLDQPRDAVLNPFGLLPEEISAIKGRYALAPVVELDGAPIFYGTTRYTDLATTAWNFADDLQGWNAAGANAPRFENGGWCFTGGSDPQLKGPRVEAGAAKFAHLELVLSLDAGASEAQIFWRAPEGSFSLDSSAVVPLARGQKTYTLTLAGAPGWQGTIGQLRLDPIPGAQSGAPPVTACVYTIQLLP